MYTNDDITPENMKINETEPEGFCSEPRVLSHEVWIVREQVSTLLTVVRQLVDLQSEANKKLEAVLSGASR